MILSFVILIAAAKISEADALNSSTITASGPSYNTDLS